MLSPTSPSPTSPRAAQNLPGSCDAFIATHRGHFAILTIYPPGEPIPQSQRALPEHVTGFQ